MSDSSDDTRNGLNRLLTRAVGGDQGAWQELMAVHRTRLRRIVAVRLDHRLNGIVDPSDVIQETFAELHLRLPEYLLDPRLPFFVWLRCLAGDKLHAIYRRHLNTQARDERRTWHYGQAALPDASSVVLSTWLFEKRPGVVHEAMRAERQEVVTRVLDDLANDDREVLVLRYFEGLTAGEAGAVLGVSEGAARKRYLRALERFTRSLRRQPEDLKGLIS